MAVEQRVPDFDRLQAAFFLAVCVIARGAFSPSAVLYKVGGACLAADGMRRPSYVDADLLRGIPISTERPTDGKVLRYDADLRRLVFGSGGPRWRGTYDSQAIYAVGDAYFSPADGCSYVVTAVTTGQNGPLYTVDMLARAGLSYGGVQTQTVPDADASITWDHAKSAIFIQGTLSAPHSFTIDFTGLEGRSIAVFNDTDQTIEIQDGVASSLVVPQHGSGRAIIGAIAEILDGKGDPGRNGIGAYMLGQARVDTEYPHSTWTVVTSASLALPTSAVLTFRAVLAAPPGFTMNVRLTDFTNGGAELAAASTTNVTPTAVSASVTPADGARRIYAVEIKVSGGSPELNDVGVFYGASIEQS